MGHADAWSRRRGRRTGYKSSNREMDRVCDVKSIVRAARDVPREMWERMQKLLLEERFSATIPQVLKFLVFLT
jgi:hypothetical protein